MITEHKPQDGHSGPPAASVENSAWGRIGLRLTRPRTALLALALLAVAIYSNTFSAAFHFDDGFNIVDNPWIKNLSNFLYLSGSRYVGFLTFALNYRFGALSVFGYHLVNLLIHIANGALVYALVRLLFRAAHTSPASPLSPAHAVALSAALLFVAHPIQTQAVTYIVQRFASLAALFYLLTVIAYLKWRLSSPDSKRRHLWYAAAFLATILGMKTKEITFTLPFMLLLVEFVFFGPPTRRQWLALIPFFLTLPIIPLSRPGALGEGATGLGSQTMEISRWDYLFTQFRVIVTYLRLLVLPVGQNLDYDYPVHHSLLEPPVFLSILFLSALFAVGVYLVFLSRRAAADPRLRLIGFGLLWFFITLSIESSIIPIRDVINEHRLYLPSAGLFMAIGIVALGYADRARVWAAMGIGVLVLILSVLTYERNLVWRDELSLWTDVVQKSPRKARGYINLGKAYRAQGKVEEAYKLYKTAVQLDPNYAEARNNLGTVYTDLGRPEEAVNEYRAAVSLASNYADPHYNLGNLYAGQGRLDQAIQEYQAALALKPHYAEAYNNLGLAYFRKNQLPEALEAFRNVVELKPRDPLAHSNLGNIYKVMARPEDAIREYRAALSLNPNFPDAHNNLGTVYKDLGRRDEAVEEFRAAAALVPNYVNPHFNLGDIYMNQGRLEEAVQEFLTVTRLKPDLPEAYFYLGSAYSKSGKTQEAARAFNRAIQLRPDYEDARRALKALGP